MNTPARYLILLLFFLKETYPSCSISRDHDEFFILFSCIPRLLVLYSSCNCIIPPITINALSRSVPSIHLCITYSTYIYTEYTEKHYTTCFFYETSLFSKGDDFDPQFSFCLRFGTFWELGPRGCRFELTSYGSAMGGSAA